MAFTINECSRQATTPCLHDNLEPAISPVRRTPYSARVTVQHTGRLPVRNSIESPSPFAQRKPQCSQMRTAWLTVDLILLHD